MDKEPREIEVKKNNGEETEAIVEGQEIDLMNIRDIDTLKREAENRLEQMKVFRKASLRATTAEGWLLWGSSYRLTEPQAEALRVLWGISVISPEQQRDDYDDAKGHYYMWTTTAILRKGTLQFSPIGTCESRDKFFAWDSKNKKFKPIEEISQQNVKKKSYTNMLVNGIMQFLGLKDVTKEELSNAGIRVDEIIKVSFEKKNEKQEPGPSPETTKSESPEKEVKSETEKIEETAKRYRDIAKDKVDNPATFKQIRALLKMQWLMGDGESEMIFTELEDGATYDFASKWIGELSKRGKKEKEKEPKLPPSASEEDENAKYTRAYVEKMAKEYGITDMEALSQDALEEEWKMAKPPEKCKTLVAYIKEIY